jgi:hypothetical protein
MVSKPIRWVCAVAALLAMLSAPAWAQRVEFPTPVTSVAQVTAPPSLPGPAVAPAVPATPGWDPYADQGLTAPSTPPPSQYALPPGYGAQQPIYSPPPVYAPPGPYAAPQPSVPAPYYTPNPAAPPGVLYPQGGPTFQPLYNPVEGWNRLLQAVRLEETYIYDYRSPRGVSVNDLDVTATFAVPVSWDRSPLFITPGFGLHLWTGPLGTGPGSPDLPAQTYDAFLDTAWDPQFTPYFGAELGVRVGVYTDFDTFTDHSIRIMGRGLGVINYSPELKFKLGLIYLDRNDVKLLPAGGVFYTPDADTRWEIFFPRPKYTHRFATTGAYQQWWYVTGEYGGGAWTIRRANGTEDDFDYNDIKVSLGMEWVPETNATALRGFAEIGYSFDRKLVYRFNPGDDESLHNTIFVRGGISF